MGLREVLIAVGFFLVGFSLKGLFEVRMQIGDKNMKEKKEEKR